MYIYIYIYRYTYLSGYINNNVLMCMPIYISLYIYTWKCTNRNITRSSDNDSFYSFIYFPTLNVSVLRCEIIKFSTWKTIITFDPL